MSYTVFYPDNCGCNGSYKGIYGTNIWNPNYMKPNTNNACGHQIACGDCIDDVKSKCVYYTGPNLVNTGINQNDILDLVLQKLDAIKQVQDQKFIKVLANLNDINDRLNALESISGDPPHPPYTLL
jgi:hypothetical protein